MECGRGADVGRKNVVRYTTRSVTKFKLERSRGAHHGRAAQGEHTEKGKAFRKKNEKERGIKSAAPGLPAWSPTAVLPRLEPA